MFSRRLGYSVVGVANNPKRVTVPLLPANQDSASKVVDVLVIRRSR